MIARAKGGKRRTATPAPRQTRTAPRPAAPAAPAPFGGVDLPELRRRVGLSQAELGRRLGYSRAAVCNWEAGVRDIPTGQIGRVIDVLTSAREEQERWRQAMTRLLSE